MENVIIILHYHLKHEGKHSLSVTCITFIYILTGVLMIYSSDKHITSLTFTTLLQVSVFFFIKVSSMYLVYFIPLQHQH